MCIVRRSHVCLLWFAALLPIAATVQAQLKLAEVNTPSSLGAKAIVGAYYYPWYGVNGRPVEGDWQNVLRRKLVPSQQPRLGLYRSDDAVVITEHITQSEQAGVSFWAVSWWGPETDTDKVFRNSILKHPKAVKLRYAILYESTGRFGEIQKPSYDSLINDFEYLGKHYFADPNYLRIDGRPVVFVYLTRSYFRSRGGEPLAKLRKAFPEVYLVGDDVFGPRYESQWARQFDAVTIYDVYGQSTKIHGATRAAVAQLAENYSNARKVANSVGTAFIPAISPGYNDRATRKGNPGTARYLKDDATPQEGSLFRAMISDAALPNLDPSCGNMMIVTSFNEWYEDSQIEATAGTVKSTTRDSSEAGDFFTHGNRYEDYGNRYLRILREEVTVK